MLFIIIRFAAILLIIPSLAGAGAPRAVSLYFDESDVRQVVDTIYGEMLHAHYVVDGDVAGKISVRSGKPVELADLPGFAERVLAAAGCGVVKDGGIYRVAKLDIVPPVDQSAIVRLLRYAAAGDVAKVMQGSFEDGSTWKNRQEKYGRLVLPVRVVADEKTNSITVLGSEGQQKQASVIIDGLDIPGRQVVIEGMVAEVTMVGNMSLGVAWAIKDVGFNVGSLASAAAVPGLGLLGVDKTGDVKGLISAVVSDSRGRLLASPVVQVANNREAKIQVGQQVPILRAETIATGEAPAQRTVEYRDIGVILRVKPRINDNGRVSLEITQEVSTYTTQKLFTDSTEVILNKTEASTSVDVESGHTVVIGGLIREDSNDVQSGVPFLRKIPLFGALFRDRAKEESRRELVILLTPRVL